MIKKFAVFIIFSFIGLYAQEKLKVGVLSFGTVNWELTTIKENSLDKKYGFDLEIIKLASKKASSIAILSNEVDMVVDDWIWINLQKKNGRDFMFYPYSKANGTLIVNKNAKINSLLDLQDEKLGIAGGKFSKTWLLFKAYYKKKYNKNLEEIAIPTFASPSILYQKMLDSSLKASINFWQFNSKLEAKGAKPLISIKEVLNSLGIKNEIAFIGWVFNRSFAIKNKKLINSFLKASHEAKSILEKNDKQWDKIRPMMRAKDDAIFNSLKQGYRDGIIKKLSKNSIKDMKKVYGVLAKESNYKYIEKNTKLNDNIFWNFEKEK
jgi:NitT/TauT family transport system substrate-binding protein